MKKKTKIIIGIVITLVALGFWLVNKDKQEQISSTGPITIGVIGPLSGNGAAYGEPRLLSIQMATEDINNRGGINGRPLELVVEDGKCEGIDAASAARKLIDVDGVSIILGGFCSSESIAAEPIATANKVLMVSDGSTSPDLTGVSPYFVRMYPTAKKQADLIARTAYDEGIRSIAIVQEQTEFAEALARSFTEAFEKLEGTIVHEKFASDETDLRTLLVKLQASGPDAIFTSVQTPASGERVLTTIDQGEWKPKIIMNNVITGNTKTHKTYSKLLEGSIGADVWLAGNEDYENFMETFIARNNGIPPLQSYMATTYDTVQLLAEAIGIYGEKEPEKIAEWFRNIHNKRGLSGNITLEPSGDRASGYTAVRLVNGEIEVIE